VRIADSNAKSGDLTSPRPSDSDLRGLRLHGSRGSRAACSRRAINVLDDDGSNDKRHRATVLLEDLTIVRLSREKCQTNRASGQKCTRGARQHIIFILYVRRRLASHLETYYAGVSISVSSSRQDYLNIIFFFFFFFFFVSCFSLLLRLKKFFI